MVTLAVLAGTGAGILKLRSDQKNWPGSANFASSPGVSPSANAVAGGVGSSPTPATGAAGCPANGRSVPANANQVRTQDLDGDERPDILWLANVRKQELVGVKTASGAVFSTSFTNRSPQPAVATASKLGDGSAIILLDFFRKAALYAVVDCTVVVSRNKQGEQYTFGEHGYSKFGDGVGCPVIGSSGRQLVGYRIQRGGLRYVVLRTPIQLKAGGSSAQNGATVTAAYNVSRRAPLVQTALKGVTCGTSARVVEPSGIAKAT